MREDLGIVFKAARRRTILPQERVFKGFLMRAHLNRARALELCAYWSCAKVHRCLQSELVLRNLANNSPLARREQGYGAIP